MCINNPHCQSSEIITFLCKYYIVTSDTLVGFFLDVLFYCFLQFYQSFIRNQDGRKTGLQKKNKRICVREITFLTARSPLHVIFCYFLSLLPFPWRTSWMTPIKIHNIAMDCILWCRKNENLLQFSTSWLASLRTWYYFRHFLASAFLPIYCYCYYINYK